jgi:hypothetical protein
MEEHLSTESSGGMSLAAEKGSFSLSFSASFPAPEPHISFEAMIN